MSDHLETLANQLTKAIMPYIEADGRHWHGKAVDLAEQLSRMTAERNHHWTMADKLADALDDLEERFMRVLDGHDGAPASAVSALQFALGAVQDAKAAVSNGERE